MPARNAAAAQVAQADECSVVRAPSGRAARKEAAATARSAQSSAREAPAPSKTQGSAGLAPSAEPARDFPEDAAAAARATRRAFRASAVPCVARSSSARFHSHHPSGRHRKAARQERVVEGVEVLAACSERCQPWVPGDACKLTPRSLRFSHAAYASIGRHRQKAASPWWPSSIPSRCGEGRAMGPRRASPDPSPDG